MLCVSSSSLPPRAVYRALPRRFGLLIGVQPTDLQPHSSPSIRSSTSPSVLSAGASRLALSLPPLALRVTRPLSVARTRFVPGHRACLHLPQPSCTYHAAPPHDSPVRARAARLRALGTCAHWPLACGAGRCKMPASHALLPRMCSHMMTTCCFTECLASLILQGQDGACASTRACAASSSSGCGHRHDHPGHEHRRWRSPSPRPPHDGLRLVLVDARATAAHLASRSRARFLPDHPCPPTTIHACEMD